MVEVGGSNPPGPTNFIQVIDFSGSTQLTGDCIHRHSIDNTVPSATKEHSAMVTSDFGFVVFEHLYG